MTQFFRQAFMQCGHRCMYCGRDLLTDFETFMLAEEDHLIPLSKGGTDDAQNIVIACAVCNRLKGKFIPPLDFDLSDRPRLIEACRIHIMAQRARHMGIFSGWVHVPAT